MSLRMSGKTPALAMKPSSAAFPAGITIQTSKEWVLPPRPKPGRKADTDNAPTKRKAQNRDAQRAFRERRAAKVGELEQQIRDIEAKHRSELEALEVDNGRLKLENIKLKDSMAHLMREFNTIRSLTRLSESPEHTMRTPILGKDPAILPVVEEQMMISPAPSADLELVANKTSPALSPLRFDNIPEAFLGQTIPLRKRTKRKGSVSEIAKKKQKTHSTTTSIHEGQDNEIDYTFSSNFRPPAGESCGFCSDGTPCLCAEAAQQHAYAERQKMAQSIIEKEDTGISSGLHEDAFSSPKRSSITMMPVLPEEDNGLCTGNPGSCRQCQLDPMSNLFCRTLAGSTDTAMPISGRPPGLAKQLSTFSTSSARDSTPPLSDNVGFQTYVPCSTAYQTLSKHQNFQESAMRDIVGGLEIDRSAGRGVELSSVRSVLRILDRGFVREG